MTLVLAETPEWVAHALDEGTADAPQVGELWTLGWDGRHEGVVVIAGVYPHHVLGFPITNDTASEREVELELGRHPVTLWPQAETGLGTFLLHAKIGAVLTPDQVMEIRRWEAGRGVLSTLTTGSAPSVATRLEELLPHFQRLCFIDWPSEAEAALDIAAVGMTPRDFATATGFATARVLALWGGMPVTDEERAQLGEHADAWLTFASDAATSALSEPALKDLFSELAALTGGDERHARNAARAGYALAARTDSAVARDTTRAVDTVKALIEEARASFD